MAYGIRYTCDWRSPMRDKKLYRIEIQERDYEGEAEALHPRGDVLTLTHGGIDDNELVALRGSQASLSLLCTDAGDPYLALFTTDPQRFMLVVKMNNDGRWLPLWSGFLATSSYSQAYDNPPYHVELTAVDGLGLLTNIPYLDDNGEKYTGNESILDIITKIMGKVGVTSIDYMDIMPVRPAQEAHTLAEVGVSNESIYSSINEEASCHMVLEALLQSFGLQIFQSFGRWRVRSIASHINAERKTLQLNINNGGKPISLYSDTDNKGVSTTSILSLMAPYKTLKVERPEVINAEDTLRSMLDREYWKILGDKDRHPYTWSNLDTFMRLGYDVPTAKEDQYYGVYYVCDTQVSSGSNINIEVSFDAINISGIAGLIRVGLFLVDGSASADDWLTIDRDKDTLAVGTTKVLGVSQRNGAWSEIVEREPKPSTVFESLTTQVELKPARWIPLDTPWDTSNFDSTEVSITANSIPSTSEIKSWHVVVLLLGDKGKSIPHIEMRSPSIRLSQNMESVPQLTFGDEPISKVGLEELTYKQHFGDAWLGLSTGSRLDAPLIEMATGSTMRTFVAPIQRCLLADTIVNDIKTLRQNVTRQLDGEVWSGQTIDLDAIWIDREGRKYYTNYIRRHLKRGVDTLQLRELPTIAKRKLVESSVSLAYVTAVVGLDTCAYISAVNARVVYRYDLATDTLTELLRSVSGTYELTLNAGQRCASIISFDGVYYTLYAYDTDGTLLSKIDKAQLLTTIGQQYYESVMRSARYDANTKLWTLIGGSSAVTYLYMIHGDGRVLASSTYSLADYVEPTNVCLIPNGFAYSSAPLTTSLFRTYWHTNAQHADCTVSLFKSYVKVLAANETYLALEDTTQVLVGVYARTDTQMGYNTDALWSAGSAYFKFVEMNNALALFQALDGGAMLYDGRTDKVHILDWVTADTKMWISGEYVCGLIPDGDKFKLARMHFATTDAVAPLLDADGNGLMDKNVNYLFA